MVLEIFEHAHFESCSACGLQVIAVAGPRSGVKFLDVRPILPSVEGALRPVSGVAAVGEPVTWQLFDGRAAMTGSLMCAKGFQRARGDSLHVGHLCGVVVPFDWFDQGAVVGAGCESVLF